MAQRYTSSDKMVAAEPVRPSLYACVFQILLSPLVNSGWWLRYIHLFPNIFSICSNMHMLATDVSTL